MPSLDCRLTLVEALPADEVTVSRERWLTLVAIGEGRTVADVDARLDLGEIKVSEAVKDLVDAGIVVIAEPAVAETAPPTAFEAVGEPVASGSSTTDDAVADETEQFDPNATSDHGIDFFREPGAGIAPFLSDETIDADPASEFSPIDVVDTEVHAPADGVEAATDTDQPADTEVTDTDATDTDAADTAEQAADASTGGFDVDLDSALDVAADHHSYLTEGETDGGSAMHEPLPEPLPAGVANDRHAEVNPHPTVRSPRWPTTRSEAPTVTHGRPGDDQHRNRRRRQLRRRRGHLPQGLPAAVASDDELPAPTGRGRPSPLAAEPQGGQGHRRGRGRAGER